MSEELKPCPFCGQALFQKRRKHNPYACCETEGCKGTKLPLLNLDMPDDIAAWNTRAQPATGAVHGEACEWCAGAGHDYYGDTCQHCKTAAAKHEAELVALLRMASVAMGSAHESLFKQCLSNGITNAWGKPVNVSKINDLQAAAKRIDAKLANLST